jgi:hypothetical protein
MNGLTRFSIQWGTYSAVSFLSFIAVVNPITTYGAGIIITTYALYLAADTYKIYANEFRENHNHETSRMIAFSDNAIDIIFFVLFIIVGLYLGLV